MSLGARLYLLSKQITQKKCKRCGLPTSQPVKSCPHCSKLNNYELDRFLEENGLKYDKNASYLPLICILAIFLGLILCVQHLMR